VVPKSRRLLGWTEKRIWGWTKKRIEDETRPVLDSSMPSAHQGEVQQSSASVKPHCEPAAFTQQARKPPRNVLYFKGMLKSLEQFFASKSIRQLFDTKLMYTFFLFRFPMAALYF